MSIATKFTPIGMGNGFPACVEKVNVSDRGDGSPFDFWTTFSGFNADSGGVPSAELIRLSLVAACKLFWNLEQVTVDVTAIGTPDATPLPDMIVNGQDWEDGDGTPDDAIEPKDRVCGGSHSIYNSLDWAAFSGPVTYGQIDLIQSTAIKRMYNGVTTDEANFIGYGGGSVDWDSSLTEFAPILVAAFDGNIVDAYASIGGYVTLSSNPGAREEVADYVKVGDIDFVFYGLALDAGVTANIVPSSLLSEVTSGATLIARAQITSLDFFTY